MEKIELKSMIVWTHCLMMKKDIAKKEKFKKESIMKKKDCEFKVVIADVYGVADDYIIYEYANTIEEAIEEVKEKLSMAERLVAIEEVREF